MRRRQVLTTTALAGLAGCGMVGPSGTEEPSGFIERLTIANFDDQASHTLEVIVQRNSDRQVVFWRRLELERATDDVSTGEVYQNPVERPGSFTIIARIDGSAASDDRGVLRTTVADRCERVMVLADFDGVLDITGGRCESTTETGTGQ